MDEDRVLEWDDEVEKDELEYVLLPEGEYFFTVLSVERGTAQGKDGKPDYPQARVKLEIENDIGPATTMKFFPLLKSREWLIGSFFKSIGLKNRGEKGRMRWNEAKGRRGRARFRHYTNQNSGRTYNEVDAFLEYNPMEHLTPVDDPDTPF